MHARHDRNRRRLEKASPSRPQCRLGLAFSLAALLLGVFWTPGVAQASGPPILGAAWSSDVASDSARLHAAIDPDGSTTSYHFEYTTAGFANCGLATNPACLKSPASDLTIPAVGAPPSVSTLLFDLAPATAYSYRVLAHNSDPGGPTIGAVHTFTTWGAYGPLLPDSRGWEMVSPVDKNGGQIDPPGTIAGGGVFQASLDGGSLTYSSTGSFAGGRGAPPASQYLARRSSGDWTTENVTAPIFSATYDPAGQGVPYQLFSTDLSRGLLLNGDHCRGSGLSGCAVANPPLAGSDAPVGYQNYYLRDSGTGGFEALLGAADVTDLDLEPADFDLRLAGASPDLSHVVLSTCAALTADASEVPQGSGCDPAAQNLYEFSRGTGLVPAALNGGTPGATLAAPAGAVSNDGDRVYLTGPGGDLYLREVGGAQTRQVDADAGGGGAFEAASSDGSIAFFSKAGSLWRYDDATGHATEIAASGLTGVLGADVMGDTVYFQNASALQRWHSGTTTQLASGAAASDPSDYPPAAGTARVSADGTRLLFLSSAPLTGYDNTDLLSGNPDSEVFLYDAGAASPLVCLSCNPTNERPAGPSTIPGAIANGSAPGSTDAYKPRAFSADGRRVFFDSEDALALTDTNSEPDGSGVPDVYQWEAQGEGSCAEVDGCVALVSSGRSGGGATFVDASSDGADAFFITDESLLTVDPGALDLYDARVGGGFPVPSPPIPCEGDECQFLPPEPIDPTLGTLLPGRGNPAVTYHRLNCKPGFVKRKGKCVHRHKKQGGKRLHHSGRRRGR